MGGKSGRCIKAKLKWSISFLSLILNSKGASFITELQCLLCYKVVALSSDREREGGTDILRESILGCLHQKRYHGSSAGVGMQVCSIKNHSSVHSGVIKL